MSVFKLFASMQVAVAQPGRVTWMPQSGVPLKYLAQDVGRRWLSSLRLLALVLLVPWVAFAQGTVTVDQTGSGTIVYATSGGGGSVQIREICFDAASLQPVDASFAPLEEIGGTSPILARAFSGSGSDRECVNGKFSVPNDLSSDGTDVVEFKVYWLNESTATALASWDFDELNIADDGNFDAAYADRNLFDSTASGTADRVEVDITPTLAASSREIQDFGWATDEIVFFRVCRDAGDSFDTTTTDAHLIMWCINIPRE